MGGGKAGFDFTKFDSMGNALSIQDATWTTGGTGLETILKYHQKEKIA
jgi:hypothetical protein